jgi:hypothetical protein
MVVFIVLVFDGSVSTRRYLIVVYRRARWTKRLV